MKRVLLVIIAALCALAAASFGGCSPEDEILRAWKREHNYYAEPGGYPLSIDMRGEYGETYVFYVDGLAAGAAITVDVVDNVYFAYPSTRQLEVYNGGKFYTLSAAFEVGLLSHADLLDIQKNYNGSWNWSSSGIIKQTYLNERRESPLTPDDIVIEVYWAGYEQFVLFINAVGDGFDTAVTSESAGGVEFTYPTTQTLLFYGGYNADESTEFNTLTWAYENGWLTVDDLLTLKHNYENGITISID